MSKTLKLEYVQVAPEDVQINDRLVIWDNSGEAPGEQIIEGPVTSLSSTGELTTGFGLMNLATGVRFSTRNRAAQIEAGDILIFRREVVAQ